MGNSSRQEPDTGQLLAANQLLRPFLESYRVVADGLFLCLEGGGLLVESGDELGAFVDALLDQALDLVELDLADDRAEQVPVDDLIQVKAKNRKIQRLNGALMMMRSYRAKARV